MITIIDEGKSEEFESGKILLQCINAIKVKVGQVCGGDGACGTCRIEIVSGWENLSPPTPDETYKELEARRGVAAPSALRPSEGGAFESVGGDLDIVEDPDGPPA